MGNQENLIWAVEGGSVTLVLGAGVSRSRNVPDWGELTARLWENTFSEDYPHAASAHPFANQFALELVERELHRRAEDPDKAEESFVDAIRTVLYESVDSKMRGRPGDSLGVIARVLKREAKESARSIRSVITFNVDSLLEEEVHRYPKVTRPLVWPVSRASDDPLRAPGAIPIYHLHGYIPRGLQAFPSYASPKKTVGLRRVIAGSESLSSILAKKDLKPIIKTAYHQLIDDAADTFVFTDWQYWRLSTTPLSFANRVFSDALHNSRCVFVGLSMTDVNLIRWLGTRSVELELDVRSEFNINQTFHAGRSYRNPHFWIRTKSADPTGLIGEFLALRGVQTVEIDSWNKQDFRKLMARAFKMRLS